MRLQPEDAIFLGAFATVLGAIGFVFKDIVLGDSGLFEQMSNPSDAKAQAGENARSNAAGGVPGLGFRLPDLDFVEVYGDARSVDRQDRAGVRLGDGSQPASENDASSAADTQADRQGAALLANARDLSSELAAAVEMEDYKMAAQIKAEMNAVAAAAPLTSASPSSSTSTSPSPGADPGGRPHDVCYSNQHIALYLHVDGYLQREHPQVWDHLLRAMCEQPGEWYDPSTPLRVRCIELHSYSIGGGLLAAGHRDHDSVLSMSVLLSDPSALVGGEFVTCSDRLPVAHKLRQGDAVLFHSCRAHNVAQVVCGVRRSLVIEVWRGETNEKNRFK